VTAADPMASFSTTDDALVLASVSSPAERELLSDWLQQQRREHPESNVAVLELPDGDPPPGVLARLVEGSASGRTVVRCGCSGCRRLPRSRSFADLRTRHYRPPSLQRSIFKGSVARAHRRR
jgi:glycerol-3-phosphate O-acyltransferase